MRRSQRSRGRVTIASEVELRSNPGERWVRVERSRHLPASVTDLLLGFEEVDGSYVARGINIRMDGQVTGTIMRDVPIGALVAHAREAAGLLFAIKPRVTAHPGAGRGGHPAEFLRQIHELHRYAINRQPRRPVAWMHEEGLPPRLRPQSIETVRTWTRQARALIEKEQSR